jgi:hypothetical protein
MKRYPLLIILVAAFLIAGCDSKSETTSSSETEVPKVIDPFDLDFMDRSVFAPNLVNGEQEILETSDGFSTYHIDIEISGDLRKLSGRQEVLYTNNEQDPLNEIYFRLFPNIVGGSSVVTSLKVDGFDNASDLEFANSAMRVPLPTPLQPGENVTISMNFELEIPSEMGGNYGLYGFFENVLVLDEFYPTIPVYNDEGWNVEIPPPNGDFPNNDAAYYVVRVKAPKDLTLVASGIIISEDQERNQQIKTYAVGPARDFYIAASDDFVVISQKFGEVTINSFSLEGGMEGAKLALGYAIDSMLSFNNRYGTYPYSELDVVSTPMLALGVEYPGVTAITLNVYDVDGEFSGLPNPVLLESVVAHEVGHQWFYNIVGNDQIDEPWIDEAITQYVTGMYYVDTYSQSSFLGYRQSWVDRWSRVEDADIPIGLPAGAYTGIEYGAIVYGRGPLFVEELAEVMGLSVFDEFMKDYYQTYKWGRSTSISFQQLAEEHCSCDLGDLFDEWVYGK